MPHLLNSWEQTMAELTSLAWEWLVNVWGWIAGACGGVIIATLGWLKWVRKNQSGSGEAATTQLSVVRAIAGPGAHELGTVLSDRVKFWRLTNLIDISEKFDRICKEKNLTPEDLRPLTIAVGLPLLEHAANEEEDELQELWANLMVSATADSESLEDAGDLYKTWANMLSTMSKWDCRLLSTMVEKGIADTDGETIRSTPLTQEEVMQAAGMPRARVDIHLEKLVSLGLVYRDPKIPLKGGGATGLEHVYAPTLMGINMYSACGNTPHWLVAP